MSLNLNENADFLKINPKSYEIVHKTPLALYLRKNFG